MGAVPRLTARVVAVEEADLLEGRPRDLGVPSQVGVKGCRPGLLRAEDEEVRQRPQGRGGTTVSADGAPQNLARRLRQLRDESAGRRTSWANCYGPVNGLSTPVKSHTFCTMPEQAFEPVCPGQPPLSRWIAQIDRC